MIGGLPAATARLRAKSKKSTVLLKLLSLKSFPVSVSAGAAAGLIIKVADSVRANNIPYNILFCIVSRFTKKKAAQ